MELGVHPGFREGKQLHCLTLKGRQGPGSEQKACSFLSFLFLLILNLADCETRLSVKLPEGTYRSLN